MPERAVRPDPDEPSGSPAEAAAARIRHQSSWVDLQIRQAVARGDFDELPGYGKPLTHLTGEHDPDWWVKQLIEREQITGVLPPSLLVRKEDAALDDRLDSLATEEQVRRAVEEFNRQVRWALYRPPEGPPVVTQQRDPALEVERWRARRTALLTARRAAASVGDGTPLAGPVRRFTSGVRRMLRRR